MDSQHTNIVNIKMRRVWGECVCVLIVCGPENHDLVVKTTLCE